MLLQLKLHLSFGLHRRIIVKVFQRPWSLGFLSVHWISGGHFSPSVYSVIDAVNSILPVL